LKVGEKSGSDASVGFGAVENLNRLFLLTPTLSLGEMEKRLPLFGFGGMA
jgi:hypothetical protein